MTSTNNLTSGMVAVLMQAYRQKGKTVNVGYMARNRSLKRSDARALADLGLLKFLTATHWEHGVGNTEGYQLTNEGLRLCRIGRMFRAFFE